jgi:pimeloyl-[acyl-carrier protein] methyl ester esterase
MSRPTLVLLHGWGLSPAVWAPLAPLWPADFEIHTLALPGHADAPACGPALADWADALLPAIPLGAIVVGWSLGALLALDLARRHPAHIGALVLTGATPRFVQAPDWPAAMAPATLSEFQAAFGQQPEATQRRFVALQSLGDQARRSIASTLGAALSPAHPARLPALARGLELLAETDLRDSLSTLNLPVRVLHGDKDTLMPVEAALRMADLLPQGRLSVLEGSGHAPFLSRPQEWVSLLESFVRDCRT